MVWKIRYLEILLTNTIISWKTFLMRQEPGWSQAGDAMFLLVVPVALTKFVKINHKYWQQCEQNSWRQTQHFLLISQHPPAPPLFSEHKSSKSWLLDEDEECEMKYFHFRYWHISKDYYFGSTNCASVTATFFWHKVC